MDSLSKNTKQQQNHTNAGHGRPAAKPEKKTGTKKTKPQQQKSVLLICCWGYSFNDPLFLVL